MDETSVNALDHSYCRAQVRRFLLGTIPAGIDYRHVSKNRYIHELFWKTVGGYSGQNGDALRPDKQFSVIKKESRESKTVRYRRSSLP